MPQTGGLIGENTVLSLQERWLWFHHAAAGVHIATRGFSLIAFSYGHWIPPQGKVQSDRSSYDNIIVRTVKGQTTAHVLFYVASAERTHRWLQHCCRASALQSASGKGKGINASEDPRPSFHPQLPSAFCPSRSCRDSCLKLLSVGYVLRRLLVSRNACSSRIYSVRAAFGTQGAYQSNWGGLTDDHLLTMWPRCLKGQRRFVLPAVF